MSTIEMPDVVSYGSLDDVQLKNSTLYIHGWAASAGHGAVHSFEIRISGLSEWIASLVEGGSLTPTQEDISLLSIQTQNLHLSSPDVQQMMPNLDEAGQSRFTVQASMPDLENKQDLIVTVVPYFSEGRGSAQRALLNPSLSFPAQEDLTTVGSSLMVGFEFLTYFIQKAKLRADEKILDVGCGVGRMAYALTHYLNDAGRYEGFDILADLITWAQTEISTRFPYFQFHQVPIYNKFYNPEGTVSTLDFEFPYADAEFDFVFLTSVFTHMQAPEIRHYLEQIQRVLKPGGRCLCTCFLINEETDALHKAGKCNREFTYPLGEAMVNNPDMPEAAIAFPQEAFLAWARECGFTISGIFGGNWCGRDDHLSYQDILLLERQ